MRILVTGSGGFLGSQIVRDLIVRGDQVLGVSRRRYPDLVQLGMQPVRGDLSDRDFVHRAIGDVEAVVHTAAVAGVWGPWKHFYDNNVLATEHLIEACQANDVPCGLTTGAGSVEERLAQGFDFVTISWGGDAGISGSAAAALEIAREASGRGGGD